MLKRINVARLEPGMYLHELCGSWISHPFWRASFLLQDPQDIRRIRDSGVEEVWIDAGKGRDVAPCRAKTEPEEPPAREPMLPPGPPARVSERTVLAEEIQHAAEICVHSKKAVVSMFQEARMGKAVETESARRLVDEINSSVMRNPSALISIARLKRADDYTYMHSVAVCGLMLALAQQLRLDEHKTREAGLAGLLHDIGKMAIPLEVLNKPGKLTDAEFALVKTHSEEGYRMLSEGKDAAEAALDVCMHHHEKVDGKGYPRGLQADAISLFARMAAVCDVYDAVTSDRPYKQGWDPGEALRKMAQWCSSHFDNSVFQAFVKAVGIYPVGTLVRLHSGRLAVVVDQAAQTLLTPTVKVFFSIKSQSRLRPEIIDLASTACGDKITAHENPAKWGFPDLEKLWRGADPQPW